MFKSRQMIVSVSASVVMAAVLGAALLSGSPLEVSEVEAPALAARVDTTGAAPQRKALANEEVVEVIANANSKVAMWQLADSTEQFNVEPVIPVEEEIEEYEVIVLKKLPVFPGQGEELVLPLLNGEEVMVAVQSTHTARNGDVSLQGHLAGKGEAYPVVFTQGKHLTHATISTPQGSYAMQSVNGIGWLYKSSAEMSSQPEAERERLLTASNDSHML